MFYLLPNEIALMIINKIKCPETIHQMWSMNKRVSLLVRISIHPYYMCKNIRLQRKTGVNKHKCSVHIAEFDGSHTEAIHQVEPHGHNAFLRRTLRINPPTKKISLADFSVDNGTMEVLLEHARSSHRVSFLNCTLTSKPATFFKKLKKRVGSIGQYACTTR